MTAAIAKCCSNNNSKGFWSCNTLSIRFYNHFVDSIHSYTFRVISIRVYATHFDLFLWLSHSKLNFFTSERSQCHRRPKPVRNVLRLSLRRRPKMQRQQPGMQHQRHRHRHRASRSAPSLHFVSPVAPVSMQRAHAPHARCAHAAPANCSLRLATEHAEQTSSPQARQ